MPKLNYKDVFSRYKETKFFFPLIGSVLELKQDGVVLCDNEKIPKSFFIIHKFGFAQLISWDENINFINEIYQVLIGNSSEQIEEFPEKIRLYSTNSMLNNKLSDRMNNAVLSPRIQLRLDDTDISLNDIEYINDVSVEILAIDDTTFDSVNDHLKINLPGRFWRSRANFLNNGIGFAVKRKDSQQFVSVVYSAAISNGIAEIDVLTHEDYKRRGYAYMAGKKFIEKCTTEYVLPNWDCFANNISSYGLAMKLGFKESNSYSFYTFELGQ